MATRITLVGLRRQMLARGLTLKPRCPACQQEKAPAEFVASGTCRTCDTAIQAAERAHAEARLAEIDARLRELWQESRNAESLAHMEAIDAEMSELEGERMEHLLVADPSAFSRVGGDDVR